MCGAVGLDSRCSFLAEHGKIPLEVRPLPGANLFSKKHLNPIRDGMRKEFFTDEHPCTHTQLKHREPARVRACALDPKGKLLFTTCFLKKNALLPVYYMEPYLQERRVHWARSRLSVFFSETLLCLVLMLSLFQEDRLSHWFNKYTFESQLRWVFDDWLGLKQHNYWSHVFYLS